MTEDLRILPYVLPPELEQAGALSDEYRRMRQDITGRGITRPTRVRDILLDLDGEQVVRAVDPLTRPQRFSRADKEAYARHLRDHMTPAEWCLWQELRTWSEQGIEFEPQAIVRGWIVDFYCAALRLVIEVDGGIHSNAAQWQRDRHKDAILERDGYMLLRFTNEAVLSASHNVAGRILEAIAVMEGEHAR